MIVRDRMEDDSIPIPTKVLAIEMVARMETHNSIRKDDLVAALRAKERAFWSKLEYVAKKVNWAVEPDPKKEGRYKIVDHDHMDELYAMSGDILADA